MNPLEPADRARVGLRARVRVPPDAHAHLSPTSRPDAVQVLAGQVPSRVPELVPVRHERMLESSWTFFRGAAAVMAADLSGCPVSGLDAQLCGDAHLGNFGVFASPERRLVFDLNDFDETTRGPWEWDVKRLAASLVVAGRQNDFSEKRTRRVVVSAVERYRAAMAAFAAMGNLSLWHSRVDADAVERILGDELDDKLRRRMDSTLAKARTRDHLRNLDKLTEIVEGRRRIVADPPLVVPVSRLLADVGRSEVEGQVQEVLDGYAQTLDPGHRLLVGSYAFEDMARKVAGVGSVGLRCWIVLMRGRDADDPLFLQVKEAQASVLSPWLPETADETGNQGRRVVVGQRVMQALSDAFLGWHRATGVDGQVRDFYVRQLHDWKGGARVESMTPKILRAYAALCGWTLARAHARSGDRIAIAAYLGDDDRFAQALADFAHEYADLNEADFQTFGRAVADGRLDTSPRSA